MNLSEFVIKRKKILIIVFAVALAMLIVPMVSAGAYTYLCEDDFSIEGGSRDLVRDYGNLYVGSAHRMVEYYNSNQGSFLYNYLMSALQMYTRGGLPGFHLFMALSLATFFFTLGLLIKQIIRDWTGTLGVSLAIALMLLEMYNTNQIVEIFYWYTGLLYMLFVFNLAFITASLSLYNIKTGKLRYAIAGMIMGFFASGGSLNVTAANCAWLLAILILTYPKVKNCKTAALPFAGALIGALINATAPGNFNRLDGGPLNVWTGLSDTFMCYISDVKILFASRIFWFSIILAFSIVSLLKIKILPNGVSNIQLAITIVGSWLVKYFVLFPVTFATRMNDIKVFTWRTYSSYEIVAKIMFIFVAVILSQWFTERKDKIAEYTAIGLIALSVLFMLITYPATKSELKSGIAYQITNEFKTGVMVENYNMREFVLSTLENSEEGSDVILYVPPFRVSNAMYGMGLDTDSGWFVNRSAAGLYNLNSVTVIYTD